MRAAQTLLDERLRALSDPTRRTILQDVYHSEIAASDIAARFDLARPTVSRHLRMLETAKLVTVRKSGTSRLYSADRAALEEMSHWFQTFWDEGLPRLKKLAEQESRTT